ncbi:MAG TPA: SsgA family sporulation/cell division regulator [Nocardioides sp.]|uniref:SsgA family sporulation/cell division regulator n=1 Tax=Nocardioides sp. TaxID=35761 RepID=UPI002CF99F48|nr:SsgA family sporulation/cell division regulator [Nocardioides sp.]HTW18300.1 SsgA family sporulation/cell division regulator [Nocardioides sp.]
MTASTSVTQAVLLRCRTPSGRRTTLTATLAFADLDPYAVRVVFHGPQDEVTWLVDRELLIAGLESSVGEGDIRIRPRRGGEAVEIRFRSPDGSLTTTLPRADLGVFLARTLDVVALGDEQVDADELLAALLASGTE